MDRESLAVEFVKIYFNAHPESLPDDPNKAFDKIQELHKKYKSSLIGQLKEKSERFVDNYFDDKGKKYL